MYFTPQQAYERATERYQKAQELIRELASVRLRQDYYYSTENALRQFDVILQCILYREAIADCKIEENERLFLRDIAGHADAIEEINRLAGTDFTWDSLIAFTPSQQNAFGTYLDRLLDAATEEFVPPLAAADASVLNRNYIGELDGLIADIAYCFAAADGDDIHARHGSSKRAVTREIEIAASYHGKYLSSKWNRIVSEIRNGKH